jgi:phosphate transport system substrate-binding protein
MSLKSALRAIVLAGLGATIMLSPAFARTLKVGGTGAVTELLRQLAPAFKDDSGIELDVVPGLGTSGANSATIDGKLGLAVAGRDLREKELAKGLKVVATLRTPFGLVTSRPGPDGLKSTEVAAFYRADKPVWPDGMPVLLTLRPVDESDNIVLGSLFPGMAEALQHLRQRRDLSVAATDQDNADAAERVKGSLVAASLVQILTEKRNLRFLAIDGVMPSLEAYENGSYPYGKALYVIAPSAMSPEAEAFVAFLAKPATTALLRRVAVVVGK